MVKAIQIGLLGFGTVGTGVVRIIQGHQDHLHRQSGSSIAIKSILVKNLEKSRAVDVGNAQLTLDPWSIINDPEINVIVEVTGGVNPTKEWILAAIKNGKHVVTANKDLMAMHGNELLAEAARNKCDIYYEASVGGGIPIIRALMDSFTSDKITKIMGIVNGTTNYMLTKMAQEGASYKDVLAEAQALGYAESDPTADVDGLDAARKMTILARLGFLTDVALEDVRSKGIRDVTQEEMKYASKLGYTIKLVGIAERQGDKINVSVQPTMMKNSHPLSSVNGVFNAVYVYGEAVGETMFYGPGAGELPTATSVVSDLVQVVKNLKLGVNGLTSDSHYKEKKVLSEAEQFSKTFIVLRVHDRAGVLAQITNLLAGHEVSLESIIQSPLQGEQGSELCMITHRSSKASLDGVLSKLNEMEVVRSIDSVYRVEG